MKYREKLSKEYLQPGMMLGDVRYRVESMWEDNDITVTYHGYDTFREKAVTIRELFPRIILARDYDRDYELICKKMSDESVFETMKEHMIARAKKLIKLYPIEGITNVITFFEEHGTVYTIEEPVEGQTLKEYFFKRHSAKFKVEDIMKQMEPVMDILDKLHEKGLVHATIAPENIWITEEKKIILSQMMNPIDDLAHECLGNPKIRQDGYSPVEMYLTEAKRTAKTDIYEVAAILYYYVTGQNVPAYFLRINEAEKTENPADTLTIIMDFQSDAIMKAISIYDFDRFESFAAFKKELCPEDIDMKSLHNPLEAIRYQMHKPLWYAKNEKKIWLSIAIVVIGLIIMVPRLMTVGQDESINHFYKRFIAASDYEQCVILTQMGKLERETYTNDYYDMDQSLDEETLSSGFKAKYYDFHLKKYVTADKVDTNKGLYEYLKIDYRSDHVIVYYVSNNENWRNDIEIKRTPDGSFKVERTVISETGAERTENLLLKE